MANSADVSSGDLATAVQYNNLRADVLNTSSGHTHTGTDSKNLGTLTADLTISQSGASQIEVISTANDAYLILNSDTDEGQDSELIFESGGTARGRIEYNHHATANSQLMSFFTADNAVETLKLQGNLATFATAVTGTTFDATTDFTVGATVITDGVITDASGLSIAAAVDLGANTLTSTGSMQIRTIDYSDGDLAMTIADGGGVTFAQAVDLGSNTLTSTGSMQIRTIDYTDGDLAMTIADGGAVTFAQITTTPSIELRADGGTPYVDFSNDTGSDYDARIILSSDDLLIVQGAELGVAQLSYTDGDNAITIADGGGVTLNGSGASGYPVAPIDIIPTYTGSGGSATGIRLNPTFTDTNADIHFGTHIKYTFNESGATQPAARAVWLEDSAVTGTVTSMVGLWIDNFNSGDSSSGTSLYIEGGGTYALHVDDGVTRIDGAITGYGDWNIRGTTPQLTIGDAGTEDTKIVFDGNEIDFHIGLDDDVNRLVIGTGTTLGTDTAIRISSTGNTTFDGNVVIESTGSSSPTLALKNFNADATSSYFDVWKVGGSPADNDYIGVKRWIGKNTADEDIVYATEVGWSLDVTDSTEDGGVFWQTMYNGTNYSSLSLAYGGIYFYHAGNVVAQTGSEGLWIGDGGTEDQVVTFNGSAVDYAIGIDDTDDTYGIHVGSNITGSARRILVNASTIYVGIDHATSATPTMEVFNKGGSGTRNLIRFADAAERGKITHDGSSTTYSTTSDYRLKENEAEITDAIDRIHQMKPYKYNFKNIPDREKFGFFAHELAEVLPEAVIGTKDAVNENGDVQPQSIDYGRLTPLLTQAIKEIDERLKKLGG